MIITDSVGYEVYFYGKIVYGLSIGIYTLWLLYQHKIEVRNYFSMVESKELTWARIFLFFNISGSILYSVFSYSISGSVFAKMFFATFDLILIFWVSYHGVQQRNILSLLAKKEDFEDSSQELSLKADLPALSKDSLEEIMQQIDDYMLNSEPFMDTELTIIDLAMEIDAHPKRISTAINMIRNQNFNAYVNQFRIRKAEQLLEDPKYDQPVFPNKNKPKNPQTMKCVELNAKGNFDPWEPSKLEELKKKDIDERIGQKLLFENDTIKLWEVVLFPGERLPFRKISGNYNLTSMTEGLALSRSANGKITLVRINKDDSMFIKHDGSEAVYDFENIGDTLLFLHAMEFKPLVEETRGLKRISHL